MTTKMFACLAAILVLASATQAFAERTFPQGAKRGQLQAYQYPEMTIDGTVYRLAPGSRIYSRENRIVMPASVQVQTARVMYLLDMNGDLSKVWLLRDEEAARLPASNPISGAA